MSNIILTSNDISNILLGENIEPSKGSVVEITDWVTTGKLETKMIIIRANNQLYRATISRKYIVTPAQYDEDGKVLAKEKRSMVYSHEVNDVTELVPVTKVCVKQNGKRVNVYR